MGATKGCESYGANARRASHFHLNSVSACVPGFTFLSSPLQFMATLRPFAALRPKPELAGRVCELPYDVMSSEEARAMAVGNPLSFLHVSKPEIDLPAGTN